jgi:exodeoxyribonuclease VII large subunit
MDNRLQVMEQNLKYYRTKLELLSPQGRIREMRTRLLDDEGRIQSAMENQIYRARQNLDIYIERMKGLSPLDKLKQGFSYVENQEGKGVTSISQVKKGDTVNIRVADGTLVASITGAEAAERSI